MVYKSLEYLENFLKMKYKVLRTNSYLEMIQIQTRYLAVVVVASFAPDES